MILMDPFQWSWWMVLAGAAGLLPVLLLVLFLVLFFRRRGSLRPSGSRAVPEADAPVSFPDAGRSDGAGAGAGSFAETLAQTGMSEAEMARAAGVSREMVRLRRGWTGDGA